MASGPPPDPLYGVMVPPGMPQPTNTPKADGASVPQRPQAWNNPGGVPAIPASLSSTNPATLAGMSGQGSLGRPTPIADHNSSGPPLVPGQATLSRTRQVPDMLGPNPNPKVEQVPDIKPANEPVTPAGSWQTAPSFPSSSLGTRPAVQSAAAVLPTSAEILSKRLQERGVLDQKQEAVPEGVRLTCYLSRGPAGGLRVLEVAAADYATAAQAILQQLDNSR
jgi:hypothetical protein